MAPPPFGTFPKIHPFWKGKASLSGLGNLTAPFLTSLSRLQAMFAGSIPEIIDLIGIRRKYGGTFKVTKRSVGVQPR